MIIKRKQFSIKTFYAFNEGEGDGTGGAGLETPQNQVPSVPTLSDSFIAGVPEEYRNESFVHDISRAEDPTKDLWTKFAGMQSALQQQPGGMPSLDAPPEAWAKWSEAVAPKDISVYGDIKPIIPEEKAFLNELLEPVYSPEVTTKILDAARQLGVQPWQMKGLTGIFNELQVGAAEQYHMAQQQAKQEQDQQFDDFCAKQFGKDRERIIGEGFDFIAQNVGPELVEHVNNLPNEALATVAALAHTLKTKYGKEDKLPGPGSMYTGGGGDIVSLKAAIGDKMNSPAYSNAFDALHNQTVAEVKQLSAQLARLTQPRKGY